MIQQQQAGIKNKIMSYTISNNGLTLTQAEEGCILHPYQDQAGVWTIGIGTTEYEDGTPVGPNDPPITVSRALQLLSFHMNRLVVPVIQNHVIVPLNQNQVDSIGDFIYNLGSGAFIGSHLLYAINNNLGPAAITAEFKKWVYINHQVSSWQVQRRQKEINLFFS